MLDRPRKFIILDGDTICQSHLSDDYPAISTNSPRRKRRRLLDDDVDAIEAYSAPIRAKPRISPPQERDKVYYTSPVQRKPGDCVLLAQNVLFTLDESLAAECSPVLKGLLQSHKRAIGRANDTTPCFVWVEPDNFRQFLWALSGGADHLQMPPKPSWDLNQIVSATNAAHDLSHATMEAFLLDAIHRYFSEDFELQSHVVDVLPNIIDLVNRIESLSSPLILDCLVKRWVKSLRDRLISPIPAILTAEKHRLKTLQGEAYYSYMLQIESTVDPENGVTTLDSDSRLGANQFRRLLTGSWSLRAYWQRLAVSAPFSSRIPEEQRQIWEEAWLAAATSARVVAVPSCDVLGILDVMKAVLTERSYACKSEVMDSLETIRDHVVAHLCAHFD